MNNDNSNSGHSNSGDWNIGDWNSGDWNIGDWNSGDWNSGDWNSGNFNSGHSNSGSFNSGSFNSGHSNSGHSNSGNRNSGNLNSGDWNSCNSSSGAFCSVTPPLYLFNKPTDKTRKDIDWPSDANYEPTTWVHFSKMSDEEKVLHPEAETTYGYLKIKSYFEMCADGWAKDDDRNKLRFFRLPNFDLEIFKEITGIDASKDFQRLKAEAGE